MSLEHMWSKEGQENKNDRYWKDAKEFYISRDMVRVDK